MQPLSCDLWLVEPRAFHQFINVASSNLIRESVTSDGAMTRNEARIRESVRSSGESRREKTIGLLPVHGVLEARPTWLGSLFGMSSYESLGRSFDALVADDSVKAIVLDCMSPGGMVYGCPELADKIFQARGTKPIIAVANPMAASGAYWLAAAADRLVVTPSGDVGSVGVIWEHVDFSQADEKAGVKVTVIRSQGSPYKAEGNPTEPLTDEARKNMQARADAIYKQFVGDLARFRGISTEEVQANYGQGRLVDSKLAIKSGMADRIDTLQGVVSKLNAGRIRIASSRAQDEWDVPEHRDSMRERAEKVREIALDNKS